MPGAFEWVVILWLGYNTTPKPTEFPLWIYRGERALEECEAQRRKLALPARRTSRPLRCEWYEAKVGEDNE